VMNCVTQPDGCLGFSVVTDCATSGMICQMVQEVASCVVSCNDTCPAAGEHRCDGNELEQCTADGNGCLSFTLVEDCAASARACTLTPTPGCACVDTCSEDSCAGTVISDCAADAHGCLHPVTGEDCATQGKVCQLAGGVASCVCSGGCIIGAQQCVGTAIQTCVDNGSGCGVWQGGTDCAGTSQQCRMNGAVAECYTPVGPVTLLSENFDSWVPAGWTVVDGGDSGYTWVQCNGCAYENLSLFTIRSGAVALIDSDYFQAFDDSLVTPTLNCSGYTTVTLEFDHWLKLYTDDWGEVGVSTNGGGSWTTVRTWNVNTQNVHETINLGSYVAGQANVKIRFRYVADFDWAWMIDTVRVTAQ
jgi:hypothetical protein